MNIPQVMGAIGSSGDFYWSAMAYQRPLKSSLVVFRRPYNFDLADCLKSHLGGTMVEAVFNHLSVAGDEEKLKEVRAQLNSPFELRVSPNEIMKYSNPVFAFWNITKPSDLETYFSDLEFTPENVLDTLTASGDHWFNWNTRNWGTAKDVAVADNSQSETMIMEYIVDMGGLAYTFYTEMTAPLAAIATLSEQFPNETFELDYKSSTGWGGEAKFTNGSMEVIEEYAFKCPTCDWLFDEFPSLSQDQIDYGSCPECSDDYEDEDTDGDNADIDETLEELLGAAKSGDTDAMEQVANIAFRIGNVELAKEWLTAAAAHGHLQSMHDLGLVLVKHNQDLEGARALWQIAADQGHPNSINSLIYTFWLAEKQWKKIYDYANRAIAVDVPLETTNAMSNLGISYYLQGNKEQAIKHFMQALNRPDGFAEGEASYFLSRIYQELGDQELALKFKQRCDKSGGYVPGRVLNLDLAMNNTSTDFESKCKILSELWLDYKDDEELGDFVIYNDLGLPLAFAISSDIVPATDTATKYVNETWDLFMEAMEIEDTGFTDLNDVFMQGL